MDSEEARAIGFALWCVRDARGKALRPVAELAGMGKDTLNRIERGLLSPTLNQLYALAEVLHTSVSELTRLPFPAPANGHTDSTTEAIGLALDAIEADQPGGMVLPVAVLRDRVARIHAQRRACRFAEVATDLPGLIRDLHTTLDTGADHGELLDLAVYLHTHVTRMWLLPAAAPVHLLHRVVFLARRLAQERDEVSTLAMAGYGVATTLLAGGAVTPGRAALGSLTLPPTTAGTAGLVCQLTMRHALAAVREDRPDEAAPALDTAAELAQRFGAAGGTDPLGFLLVPADVGIERMSLALRANEPDRAVGVASTVHPERHPFPAGQANYWLLQQATDIAGAISIKKPPGHHGVAVETCLALTIPFEHAQGHERVKVVVHRATAKLEPFRDRGPGERARAERGEQIQFNRRQQGLGRHKAEPELHDRRRIEHLCGAGPLLARLIISSHGAGSSPNRSPRRPRGRRPSFVPSTPPHREAESRLAESVSRGGTGRTCSRRRTCWRPPSESRWNDGGVISHEDVRRAALSLPGSYEQVSYGGRPSWRTKARMFTWIRDDPEALVVWVESAEDKDALITSEPDKFLMTPHYDGHAILLVRLDAVDAEEATELITESWRLRAPRSLVRDWDAMHG